jgi:hypothetical protein
MDLDAELVKVTEGSRFAMVRVRISHHMALIALVALVLVCVRVLLEDGSGAESFGRKMTASVFLVYGIIVLSCFAVAYIRGSPDERRKLFSPPPEYLQFRSKISEHWVNVVRVIRTRHRR